MYTFQTECELVAKKMGVKFEHLVGRTELYLGDYVSSESMNHVLPLSTKGFEYILLKRGDGIVLVLDYTSEMLFNQPKN